jgi:hypothetical protein
MPRLLLGHAGLELHDQVLRQSLWWPWAAPDHERGNDLQALVLQFGT